MPSQYYTLLLDLSLAGKLLKLDDQSNKDYGTFALYRAYPQPKIELLHLYLRTKYTEYEFRVIPPPNSSKEGRTIFQYYFKKS